MQDNGTMTCTLRVKGAFLVILLIRWPARFAVQQARPWAVVHWTSCGLAVLQYVLGISLIQAYKVQVTNSAIASLVDVHDCQTIYLTNLNHVA